MVNGWQYKSKNNQTLIKDALSTLRIFQTTMSFKERLTRIEDQDALTAINLRLMQIFADKFGFRHVFRGGDFSNVRNEDNYLFGSFGFDAEEAIDFAKMPRAGGSRKQPCLIVIPIDSIVQKYIETQGKGIRFVFEHGVENTIDHSFDILTSSNISGMKVFKVK